MPKDTSLERLALGSIEFKRAMGDQQAEEGVFNGYGALFGDKHPTSSWELMMSGRMWTDTIAPGAFKRTMAEHKARGTMPAMLCMHDHDDLPVGAWLSAEEDEKGLFVEGQLATKTDMGMQVYELMKMKALTGLSIGFTVAKATLDEKAMVRTIKDVDLFEISPVSIPAIAGARVEDVKALDTSNIRSIERRLRDAGFSQSEAKRLLAGGFKALASRDADDEKAAQFIKKLSQTIRG